MYKVFLVFVALFSFLFSGCVSTTEYNIPQEGIPVQIEKKGIYHKVAPGETIWRIAKTYDISIDDIIKNNRIPNIAQIEKGQLIFIPGASSKKTITLDKSNGSESNDFAWPLKGKIISYFGEQKGLWANQGINVQSQAGETVCASRSGEVVFVDELGGNTKTIIIDHKDGYLTVYSQIAAFLVKLGDTVQQGSPIAKVGDKGELAFLHFEIRKNETADNPLYYLP